MALHALIAATVAATLAAIVTVGALSTQAFQELTQAAHRTVQFEEYHGRIVHGREAMTHAARMAAFTGDTVWLDRHEAARERLSSALSAATALSADTDSRRAAAATQVANEALLGSERIAGHFVRSGQLDRARDTLTDSFYAEQAAVFDASMSKYFKALEIQLKATLSEAEVRLEGALYAAVIAIIGAAMLWALVLRHLSRQSARLARAKLDVEEAHAQLARSAARRDASLFEDSPVAIAERDQSALAELVRELRAAGVDDLEAWLSANPERARRARAGTSLRRVNRAFVELVGGESIEQLAGLDRYETADCYAEVFLNDLRACWRGDLVWTQGADLPTLTGDLRRTISFARPQRGYEATWERVLYTVVDVTDLARVQAALSIALDEARSASRAKSEFLAVMSHEIRTPMNGVLGMAGALERTELSARQREMLEVIAQSGDALLQILNDLLDISKIEAGRLEIETTTFMLIDVLNGAEALFGPRAREKGLAFNVRVDPAAHGCYLGDPARIRQIVYNLASNAVKFTERGAIDIVVSQQSGLDDSEIGACRLHFEVRDTGVGIPADVLPHLFQPFHQADASISRRFGGTGLGLSIAKRLAQLMGGNLSVESQFGLGSVFRFDVAVDAWSDERLNNQDAIEAEAINQIEDERPLRLLAADDNEHNRLVLRALLEPADASLVFAENGQQAFELWRDNQFDLILMDIQMPIVDGVQAVRMIRAEENRIARPRTPIVALTANALTHQVETYLAAGMDAHVAKPIKPDALFGAILTTLAAADHDVLDAAICA